MINNKKISKEVYMLSIVITLSIIILTFSFNWYLNYTREVVIKDNIKDIQLSIEDSQLELFFITNYMKKGECNILEKSAMEISRELQENNKKLLYYEKTDEREFKRLKAEHVMIFAKLWMMNLRLKENCNSSRSTILYFFDTHSDESAEQGYVLDSLYSQYKNNIFIFPIDAEFNMGIIKLLKSNYNVTVTPTIIVNEEKKFEGLTSKEKIEEALLG